MNTFLHGGRDWSNGDRANTLSVHGGIEWSGSDRDIVNLVSKVEL